MFMDKSKCKIAKVFMVKDQQDTYYVQVMPGHYDFGRDFAIMKNRKRLYYGRVKDQRSAIGWLLKYLMEQNERQLDLF